MSEYVITIDGNKKKVNIINEKKASIDGKVVDYGLESLNYCTYLLRINNNFYEISSEKIDDEKYSLLVKGKKISSIARTELQERAAKLVEDAKASSNHRLNIKAPMPGVVLKIKKNAGDEIDTGDSILILEAMKMENDLKAPSPGKIKEIFVSEGSAVEKGDELFLIE
ncbi:MAG: acetyl-CoA carboxylase biotin carboxyl carrier protein subunit [Bacteroidetes bacterium]|nr:acetyl-CoA carboxylase biotin carboxyl carrier protein subunit [Bacteroidota bacterium]MCH8033865.1 acetyl-CoA carboxylase biotin carboxyl carrier protein subunit [Bacteroidota bacterium]